MICGESGLILMVLNDQGGGVMQWYKNEISPTLRAQDHGHPPNIVLKVNAEPLTDVKSGD